MTTKTTTAMTTRNHDARLWLLFVLIVFECVPLIHGRFTSTAFVVGRGGDSGGNNHQEPINSLRGLETAVYQSSSTAASAIEGHDVAGTTGPIDIAHALQGMKLEHEKEIQRGFEVFGSITPSASEAGDKEPKEWLDTDFTCRKVPNGHAGPDEEALGGHGNYVFTTVEPVFTKQECEALITETREAIEFGLSTEDRSDPDGSRRTNSELGEAKVSTLPRARQWLQSAMRDKLLPLLESRFGIPANELTLHDSLIIGYGYFGPAKSQPIHRDASLISLNLALSPLTNYSADGGGTYFECLEKQDDDGGATTAALTSSSPSQLLLKMDQGHVMCHAGGNMHAGNGIAQGERWVLVLFVLARDQPQLARRCHASGMLARQQGDLQLAETMFQAGLTAAPNDHLLHFSLGGIYSAKGDESKARDCLRKTFELYPDNAQPILSLGGMLMDDGDMELALQALDAALEDGIQDRDVQHPRQPGAAWTSLQAMGFEARVQAAHCALVLCTQQLQKQDQHGSSNEEDALLRERLETTRKRLEICLAAAPGHPRLGGMMAQVEKLWNDNLAE